MLQSYKHMCEKYREHIKGKKAKTKLHQVQGNREIPGRNLQLRTLSKDADPHSTAVEQEVWGGETEAQR